MSVTAYTHTKLAFILEQENILTENMALHTKHDEISNICIYNAEDEALGARHIRHVM